MNQCRIFRLGSSERRAYFVNELRDKGFFVTSGPAYAPYIELGLDECPIFFMRTLAEVGSKPYMNLQACDYQAIALLPTAEAIYHYLISEANPSG